jgi:hypothetical protein
MFHLHEASVQYPSAKMSLVEKRGGRWQDLDKDLGHGIDFNDEGVRRLDEREVDRWNLLRV